LFSLKSALAHCLLTFISGCDADRTVMNMVRNYLVSGRTGMASGKLILNIPKNGPTAHISQLARVESAMEEL
jgi:hypothetical protein